MKYCFFHYLLLACFATLCFGCSVTKYVDDENYLLVKNKLKFTDSIVPKIDKAEFENEIRPLTNKKVFFTPLFLYLYNWSSDKGRGIDRWLRKVGEPPVLLDSTLLDVSKRRLLARSQYSGYNHAIVDYEVVVKKKKATATYSVFLGEPHIIRKVYYEFENPVIDTIAIESQKSLLKAGNLLEHAKCEDEADRIVSTLRNKSYFAFGKPMVKFLIDTTMGNFNADITVKIIDDTTQHDLYKKHYVRHVTIDPYYNVKEHYPKGDTTHKVLEYESYKILYTNKKPYLRPSILRLKTFLQQDKLYREELENQTYSSFASLAIIRSIKVDFKKPDSTIYKTIDSVEAVPLDVEIKINNYKHSLGKVGGDVSITSDGLFGVRLYGEYQHRNLFGGGELFSLGGNAAFRRVRLIKDGPAYNSFEYSVFTSITFPQFLLPLSLRYYAKVKAPTTQLSFSVDYQNRVDYQRLLFKTSFGYAWRKGQMMSFSINPIDFNLTNVTKIDSLFLQSISGNPYLSNAYQNQIEFGSYHVFSYSNKTPTSSHYQHFVTRLDIKGNLLYLGSKLFGATVKEGQNYYEIFSTRFAQYVQLNINYSFAKPINELTTVAFNFFLGTGLPYANSIALPIEKMYYSGGASSLRGWQLRTIGPGTYVSTNNYLLNNLSDFKLEFNAEYRFKIASSMIEGAVFADAGNIWTLFKGDPREGALLTFKNGEFFKGIALNTGIGVRLLVLFVVFRVDWGLQLYSPITQKVVQPREWFKDKSAIHIAINYPF